MDHNERQRRLFIFLTFVLSCLAVALLSAAVGTDYWIFSRLKDLSSDGERGGALNNETARAARQVYLRNRPGGLIHFGLFHGFVRHNRGLGDRQAELQTVCDVYCAHVMIVDPENPSLHLSVPSMVHNVSDSGEGTYRDLSYTELCGLISVQEPNAVLSDIHMFNYSLWAATVFFVSAAIVCGIVSAIFSLLNTTYTPVAVINGIAGIYLWNSIGIFCSLLCIFMWIGLYYSTFQYNVLPAELLYPIPKFSTCGLTELGYSFWLCLVALLLYATNIILLTVKDLTMRRATVKNIVPAHNENMFMY
ncbi:hypothetical protein RvY_03723 [Ramazzottius varieornatus]|uniref:Uncharacterized protein n=1 Tax=Ramazzottius varieornatus TaxID=947166 RepID=A0A1D1UYG7_RAMVA|nr:hypothetical protein RvY_03723 [Ramazzottius varieornatus]